MLYLVSYDLNGPDANYPALSEALRRSGATKILYSEWLVDSSGDAKGVADYYLQFMDANDAIFVTEVTTNTAWKNLQNGQQASTRLNASSVRKAA